MKETSEISGKRVLITGGTTGIGRAIALLLAENGADVFICGRHRKELEEAREEGRRRDIAVSGTVADVSASEEVERLFREAVETLGGIDILINNAGIAGSGVEDEEEWRYVIDTNLSGYLDCTIRAVRHFRGRSDPRHIVLIGSMSADVMEGGNSIYVATKCAIAGFATSLRKEVNSQGIHVHLIEPGSTRSDMAGGNEREQEERLREESLLMAEDIAQSVLYVLTQPGRCSVVDVKLRPLHQLI